MTVYLAQGCETKLVKIGFSQQTWERVRTVPCAGSDKLTLLRVIPGGRVAEQWMHRKFKHLRCHGEWFSFDDQMLTVEIPEEFSCDTDQRPLERRSSDINLEQEVYRLIAENYTHLRGASKKLAKDANGTARGAMNWLERRNMPSSEALINLMAANPSIRAGINDLVADLERELAKELKEQRK